MELARAARAMGVVNDSSGGQGAVIGTVLDAAGAVGGGAMSVVHVSGAGSMSTWRGGVVCKCDVDAFVLFDWVEEVRCAQIFECAGALCCVVVE